MPTGFTSRDKGKTTSANPYQLVGEGLGALVGGGGQLNVQGAFAGVGNGADTTEDTLFTYSLPPKTLWSVSNSLLLTAYGTFANNAHSKTVKLYFGAEIISIAAFATAALTPWWLQLAVQKVGSSQQVISAQSITGSTHNGLTFQTATETDTSAITIKVTGQTGTSGAGDVLCYSFIVSGFN
jgi:hypothetical protein